LKQTTIMLLKENYQIIYDGDYPGYSNGFEQYELHEDIDEKEDLC
jgi:hypothetical protein